MRPSAGLQDAVELGARRDSNGDGQITLADDPLELLFDGATRATTAVVGLACTGGLGATDTTILYRSAVSVTCGADSATVDPSVGPGFPGPGLVLHTATGTDPLFGAAVYVGDEQLGFHKRYWNVALGLAGGASCRVSGTATAHAGYFPGRQTPADAPWPVITWVRRRPSEPGPPRAASQR